jgi:hypothetical protein
MAEKYKIATKKNQLENFYSLVAFEHLQKALNRSVKTPALPLQSGQV